MASVPRPSASATAIATSGRPAIDAAPIGGAPAGDDPGRPGGPRGGQRRGRSGTEDQHPGHEHRQRSDRRQPPAFGLGRHVALVARASQRLERPGEPASGARDRQHRLAERDRGQPAAERGEHAAASCAAVTRGSTASRTPTPAAARATSASSVTRRSPSGSRTIWTTRSTPRASCSRTASCGSPTPAISARVSIRRSASSGEFACTVESAPSWPVLSAVSRSSASAPRTSPITIRSGRMRSALRSRSRIVTSPRPSTDAGRLSSRTTCGWRNRSSAASSIVTTRSLGSIQAESAFSRVVLPEPVPPETRMLRRAPHRVGEQLAQLGGQRPAARRARRGPGGPPRTAAPRAPARRRRAAG